jgi:thioredoxin reductase (NADPH)
MSQPVLFVIDNDAGVVRALRGDLTRRFGEDFRVISESPAAAGLAALRGLADLHEPVALLIADHHLSGMPGIDFLARAHDLHPMAKRVLLIREIEATANVAVRLNTEVSDGATAVRLTHEDLAASLADKLSPAAMR